VVRARVPENAAKDMSHWFSLNRETIGQGLSALLQRVERRRLRADTRNWNDPHTLPDLIEIEKKIDGRGLDLDPVMNRVVKVTQTEFGADGVGVWLFTTNEIFFCAGAGDASNDERLRLLLLSTLLTHWQLSKDGQKLHVSPQGTGDVSDAGAGPGEVRSWLVEPISQGSRIAGVLAAFSYKLDAFTQRDATKAGLLATVLAQALRKFAETGEGLGAGLEPATMLQLIEQMIPGLETIITRDESSWRSALVFQQSDAARGSSTGTTERQPAEERTTSEGQGVGSTNVWARVRQELHHCGVAALKAGARTMSQLIATAGGSWKYVTMMKDRVSHSGQDRFRHIWPQRALRASLIGILGTAIVFLILKTSDHNAAQPISTVSEPAVAKAMIQSQDDTSTYLSSNQGTTQSGEIRVSAPTAPVAGTTSSFQVSHLQVTDRNTQATLRNLSSYELAGLRRKALYGDDSAALLLGMALEVGHGVRQDCKAAAWWMAKAAAEGNALAQYNLGLRYRDGDGVQADEDVAIQWLQKAASRQVPGARLAMIGTSRHLRVSPQP
jgi:hypothetical protein